MITRAVGAGDDPGLDVVQGALQGSDRFVICSDGLTNELPDERLHEILQANQDPQAAAEELVRAAVEAGGRDNVSVVVIKG